MSYRNPSHLKTNEIKVRVDDFLNKEVEEMAYQMRVQKAVLGRIALENLIHLHKSSKNETQILIPVHVDIAFSKHLDDEARKQGISKSDLLNQFIANLLNDTKEIVAA